MLLRFRIANVRSFRDEQELSLVVQPGESPRSSRQIELPGGRELEVYPLAGVFGANASGKSNLLAAFVLMRSAVLNSYAQWASYEGVPREVFSLDPTAAKESSFFEIDFVHEDVRYAYGFELGAKRVEAEWLHAYPRGRRQVWFERDAAREQVFEFPAERIKDRAQLVRLTRPNALFLTVAATNNQPQLSPLYYWFQRNLWLVTPENDRHEREHFTRQQLTGDQRDRIEELLRVADLGIAGAEVETTKTGDTEVRLLHQGRDGQMVAVDWERESFGTRSWFALLGPVLLALDTGAVLLVDELDSSLHPRFAAEVIRLFQDPEVNSSGAQLVFTSHDVTILSTPSGDRLLDPGQVWLTEKDDQGATELYPLTAAEPGEQEDLTQSYLAGRFGAVPALSEGQIGRHLLTHDPIHESILVVDVEGSSDPHRDDRAQARIRSALYRLLRESFSAASVPWEACTHQDQGDGVVIVVPAKVSKILLLDPLLDGLSAAVAEHNRRAPLVERIRLRLALHSGEVVRDDHGLVGAAVILACRLLDASQLRTALRHSTTDLAVIVSDVVYDDVVRHGHRGIDPAAYHPVIVEVKKTRARGWIHLPGSTEPPVTVDEGARLAPTDQSLTPSPRGPQPTGTVQAERH